MSKYKKLIADQKKRALDSVNEEKQNEEKLIK